MNYRDKAARMAAVLREKLTAEEFAELVDLDGDYTTSDWLLEELLKLEIVRMEAS